MPERELVNIIKWRDDPSSQKVVERLSQMQDRAERLQTRLDDLRTQSAALSRGWRDLDSAGANTPRTLDTQSASAQRAEQQLQRLKEAVRETKSALEDTDRVAGGALGLEAYAQRAEAAAQGIEQARLLGWAESRTRALTGTLGTFGGDDIAGVGRVAAEFFSLGEAAGQLRHELPALVDGLGLTATNAGLLAGGVTAAAAGVYLLYDAITEASKKAREEAEKDIKLLKSEEEGLAAGLGMTTEEINKAIQAQEQEITLKRQSVAYWDDILATQGRYNKLLDDLARAEQDIATASQMGDWEWKARAEAEKDAIEDALNTFVKQFGEDITISPALYDEAKKAIRALIDEEIPSLEYGIDGLKSAFDSAIVAARDAAAAEEELFNTRRTVADQLLADAEKDVREQAARRAELESIMPDDVDDILQSLATDLEAVHAQQGRLNKLYRDGGIDQEYYREQMQALNETERDLVEAREHYQTVAAEAARQNQLEADALERVNELTKARRDLIKQEAAAQERLAAEMERARQLTMDYLDKTAETRAKRELQAQREEEDFERQRARDTAAHYTRLAQLDARYHESVAAALQRLSDEAAGFDKQKVAELAAQNKAMQRLAQDHAKRMLQIQRDMAHGLEGAVEDRDVTAAIQAARQAQQQARDEQEQYDDERKRREEDFDERLKELDEQRDEKLKRGRQALNDLRQQHQRERQTQIAAFNASLALQDQERRIKLQRQQEDYRNEDMLRQRHFANQVSQYSQHFANVHTVTQTGMGVVANAVLTAWQALAGSISGTPLTVSGGGSARYVSGEGRAKPYGTGGKILPDQWVMLGDTGAELAKFHRDGSWEALNPRQTQQVLSQPSVALSVPVQIYDASSPAMIEAVFEQRVIPKLIQAARQVPARAGAR